jgi:Kef-type K+ transport system membrane component KefB/mannitol/fructose-specific phosphotransferase system IIA component (Ntr-type)
LRGGGRSNERDRVAGEHDIAIFLVGIAILLTTARVLGEVARRLRFPAVAGELAAGVILGPTLLGRLWPGSVAKLFPKGAPANMLSGYTLLSAVLLLTLAGLEIDLSVVVRRRREAAATSLAGVALPMLLGFGLGWVLPSEYLVDPSRRLLFSLFLGTALSISAMPVIAKTLLDLGLLKTDLGNLVMSAAMIDDLAGWLLFSLLVGPLHGHEAGWTQLALRILAVVLFVTVVIGLGRRVFDRLLGWLEEERMSAAGRVLSALIVLAVFGAAITQAIGIHAVFGAFIVGVAIGDSPRLRAETRAVVHELVSNVFAPVFFAAVGLRVDFVAAFEPWLVLEVIVLACIAKVIGCTLGARSTGLGWREAVSVGFAMNSRGAMEIILALIALEAGLIKAPVFVALVLMALVTSLLAGPAMQRLLRARGAASVRELAEEGSIVLALRARTAEQAIRELATALAAGTPLDGNVLAGTVLHDEEAINCGVGDGVALPHARLAGLPRPILAFGRAPRGIDVNAPDGKPAQLFFLLVVPRDQPNRALDIYVSIMQSVATEERRDALLAAKDRADLLATFADAERSASLATA